MSLGAIYLWEPEIFTAQIPSLNESERVAYELYQQHRDTPAAGKKLQDWAEYMVQKVTNSDYSEYFSKEVQQWCINLQHGLTAEPCAILELEHFDIVAQGDALYRVFYEAVQNSGVGFYEPRFSVWGIGLVQVPDHAVTAVLTSFLKPLSAEQQSFELDKIEAPRNIKKAEELFKLWCLHHPILKNLELHRFYRNYDFIEPQWNRPDAENNINSGMRHFIFISDKNSIFYQLKVILWSLTQSPDIDLTLDITNHFLTEEMKHKFAKKLKIRIDIPDIRNTMQRLSGAEQFYALNFNLNSRWESSYGLKIFFQEFDRFINFLHQHFANGNLRSLQTWAYGDVIDHILVQMHWSQELMIIALGLDKDYLEKRYQYHCEILRNEKKDSELDYLNNSYAEYKVLMTLVEEAGTALPPYQKIVG
ncbi:MULTISPECIES: hypothetical protein [Acinetobacter]|uniref:hypothetical protein n=1 Tax=Acinetobacter TaxID=469 RepID=UPI00051B4669|nr:MULTISPECIES: hypothetical protein [Acinetobacter]MCH7380731.1 hypothetical protein [Acinetobacter higginsii]MCJ0828165.1 hypothetical protein [Acinetobacter sp. NIPH1876]